MMKETNSSSAGRQNDISNIDSTLRVIHVGGRGDMGPVESLFQLGENLSLSIVEADIESGDSSWSNYDSLIDDYSRRYGVKLAIIPKCLSNCIGKKEFHLNVMPDCSSLLNVSPQAKNYTRMDRSKYRLVWGEICQPTRTIEIEVTTLDKLLDEGVIESPHFLSLDVQGAEYNILEGASKTLQGDLLGVVSEVEFRELYENQKLFMDQHILLKNHQFSLFDLYNIEYWYSGPILDKGAIMVAEALFLRDFRYFIEKYKEPAPLLSNLSKLAIVAYYFDRRSYAFEIMSIIMADWAKEWSAFVKQNDVKYLHVLAEFYRNTKALEPRLKGVPTYQEFMAKGGSTNVKKPRQILNSALSLAYNVNLKMVADKLRRI